MKHLKIIIATLGVFMNAQSFDWNTILVLPAIPSETNIPSPQVLHFFPFGKSVMNEKDTANYIKTHMQDAKNFDTDAQNLLYAVQRAQEKNGLYLEFGVCRGITINFIAALNPKIIIHGFDSFEGLPADWPERNMAKGTFAFKDKALLPQVLSNVKLHIGLFDSTLPVFVQNELKSQPIAFIHVDCDLYESTKSIFDNLKDNIVSGTVIVFDEYFNYTGWQKHEFKAFQEFIKSSGLRYEYLSYNTMHEQVTIRIL